MEIRPITDNDISPVAQVYVEAFKEVDPTEAWTNDRAKELIGFLFGVQHDLAFLIEDNGVIGGGVLGMIKPWWDGNHLVETELFLLPSFQKRGLGSALFHHYLSAAVKRYNVTQIESLTFRDLEFPLSWYVRLGFEAKEDWQVMFGNVETIISNLSKKV